MIVFPNVRSAAGLSELVAPDLARYAELARTLAGDSSRLRAIREQLRDVRNRPLFDADAYATAFADALFAAWRGRRA